MSDDTKGDLEPKTVAELARALARDAAAGEFLKSARAETDAALAGFPAEQELYRQQHADLLQKWTVQSQAAATMRDKLVKLYANWKDLLNDTACVVRAATAEADEAVVKAMGAAFPASEAAIAKADAAAAAAKATFLPWKKPVASLTAALAANDTEMKVLDQLLAKDGKDRIPVIYRFWFGLQPGIYDIAPEAARKDFKEAPAALCATAGGGAPAAAAPSGVWLVDPEGDNLEKTLMEALGNWRKAGEEAARTRADAATDKVEYDAKKKRADELRKAEEATIVRQLQDLVQCEPATKKVA